jgi:hypothetical protein
MPTLLIVQVGLVAGRTAGDANDCERPGTRSVVLDTILITNHENRDVMGMQTQDRDTLDSDDRQDHDRSLSFPIIRA